MAVKLGRQCLINIVGQTQTLPPVVVTSDFEVIKQIVGYRDDLNERVGLRVSFQVTKSLDATADTAVVTVYNLNRQSRVLLTQRSIYYAPASPRYLQLSAGYEDSFGTIFNGTIVKVINTKRGPDWITRIEASAALAQVLNNGLEKSWSSPSGVPATQIINDLFGASGLPAPNISSEAQNIIDGAVFKSFVASGSAYESSRGFFDELGLEMTSDVDGVWVTKANGARNAETRTIDEDSGLIGSPMVGDLDVGFKTLLDPTLTPGKIIKLESRTLEESTPGLGKEILIWTLDIAGDTHGDDWHDNIKGFYHPFVVSPSGALLQAPKLFGKKQ